MARYLRRNGAEKHEIFLFTEGLAARGDMQEVEEAAALEILNSIGVASSVIAKVDEAITAEPEVEVPSVYTVKSFGFGNFRVMLGTNEVTGNLPKAEAQTEADRLNA